MELLCLSALAQISTTRSAGGTYSFFNLKSFKNYMPHKEDIKFVLQKIESQYTVHFNLQLRNRD